MPRKQKKGRHPFCPPASTYFADGVRMVVEGYARLAGEQRVCVSCHEQLTGIRGPRAAQ